MPETFLVDAGGVVGATVVGPIDERTRRAGIDCELARRPNPLPVPTPRGESRPVR